MVSVTQIIRRRRARRNRRLQQQNRQHATWIILGLILFFLVVLPLGGGALVGISYYNQLVSDLPDPETTIYIDPAIGASQLFDRSGQTLLWSVEDPLQANRAWAKMDDLPPYLVQATLLQEDPDFLQTAQFSPAFTAQQLFFNYFSEDISPADLTLTGRLVRNIIEPEPEQITREYRAREFALVGEIDRLYSPESILEWHLNTNYYGNDAYGIDAAAQVYFGKAAADLTLNEAAMLAAIPRATQYNPIDDDVAARGRQSDVLRDLLLNNQITEAEYNAALANQTLIIDRTAQSPILAADYTRYARRQAETILNQQGFNGTRMVSRGGLRIITALDLALHEQVTCTLQTHLARLNGGTGSSADACAGVTYLRQVPVGAGALPDTGVIVVMDVNTGELLAAVGDISNETHQPGPILHPFVYFQGFSTGFYTPATMLLDIPQRFPGTADGLIYTPNNPDDTFQGPVNLRDAMGAGLLPPAVQLANIEGLDNIIRNARLIGLSSLNTNASYDLSILERGGGISVLDATYAYSVFATLGEMRGVGVASNERNARPRDPVAVLRIESPDGDILWEYNDDEQSVSKTPILEPGLGYLVNDILSDLSTRNPILGAGNVLEFSRPAAVIFGAAGNRNNLWTVGYSPNMAVGVWIGRSDDAAITLDARGITGAAPVWRAVMELVHDRYGLGADDWERPANIVEARVCERSGLRPTGACPEQIEIFLENTQPPEDDPFWQAVTVNSQTGQLATANTPTSFREERVFFVPPPEAANWWEDNQLPLPPENYDTLTRPELVQSTIISSPELLDYVQGLVDVRGVIDVENLQYYQLSYGQGLNPSEWTDITGQRNDYEPGQSIGIWDTTRLDGLYNLRLTVVLNDNSIDPYIVQVTVDNVPPTVSLSAGEPGQIFTFLNDDVIPLQATATDNIRIDRVEFYQDGEFVGIDETFPFGYAHPITQIGTEQFSAVVFDAAGNQSSTELTVDVLRGGT